MRIDYRRKLVRRLVPVRDQHGTVVRHEWVEVEGRELDLSSLPPIQDGDTVTITEELQYGDTARATDSREGT